MAIELSSCQANMTTEPSAVGKVNMVTQTTIAVEPNMNKKSFVGID